MDNMSTYQQVIETTLREYASVPYAHGDIQKVVLDRPNNHYLLVNVGWQDDRRIHGSIIHIDIIDGKIWIQRDGYNEMVRNTE